MACELCRVAGCFRNPGCTWVEHEDAVLRDDALDVLQVDNQSALAGEYRGRVRRRQLRVQQPQVPQLQGTATISGVPLSVAQYVILRR